MLRRRREVNLDGSPDKVIRLGVFDDTILKQPIAIDTTFLFDGVLDAMRLRSSLESLIQQDGWKKVGARLRRNVSADYLARWMENS